MTALATRAAALGPAPHPLECGDFSHPSPAGTAVRSTPSLQQVPTPDSPETAA
ncbi:hypothetical protein SAMN05216489_05545 [Streptomyces sp. 3213]|nr:hypothetical protein SAMN05216489_05545 [Streptomyces sp. 3213] [Streptomyces sp. 3213.3]